MTVSLGVKVLYFGENPEKLSFMEIPNSRSHPFVCAKIVTVNYFDSGVGWLGFQGWMNWPPPGRCAPWASPAKLKVDGHAGKTLFCYDSWPNFKWARVGGLFS